jgi:ribosome-associated heat shock protein Hsp15
MAAKPPPSRVAESGAAGERQRLDKWLWFARIVKTRRQAVDLIVRGHVRVESRRVETPAKLVGPGEVLTIALERQVRVLRIVGLAERRGGASEAQTLFVDLAAEPRNVPPSAL